MSPRKAAPSTTDMTGWTPVGGWVRVSTTEQDADNQWPDIEAYCQTHHYQIVETYQLDGKSAFTGKQESLLQTALSDVRSGKIKAVVAWASDRMERRGVEYTLRLLRQFSEAGGRIEFVKEQWLTADDGSAELLGAVAGWVNHQESVRKKERQMNDSEIRANDGKPTGKLAYGYARLEDGRQIPNGMKDETIDLGDSPPTDDMLIKDSPAWIVREIFRRYAAGEGPTILAKNLNDRHIPVPRPDNARTEDPKWRSDSIRRMLRMPVYAAKRKHRGEILEGVTAQWPPLIDRDLWYSVQERLETRRDESGKQYRSSDGPYLMAATALCDECGGRMECLPSYQYRTIKGVRQKGVRNGQHYGCANLGCNKVSIEQEELDEFVRRTMILWLGDEEVYTQLNSEDNSEEVAKYRAQAREYQGKIDENDKAYEDDVITAKVWRSKDDKWTGLRDKADQAAKAALVPSVFKGAIGKNAARAWIDRSVQQNREIVRAAARIRVRKIGRGHNNQFRTVSVADRISWEWIIGPDVAKHSAIPAEKYTTPREKCRAALVEDPILSQLNHKEISRKLGTSGDTIAAACQSLIADGTLTECTHTLTADGKLRGQKLVVAGGTIRAALTDDPALSQLTHRAIAVRLGMSAKNVMRACQMLIADGTLTECTHTLNEDGTTDRRVIGRKRLNEERRAEPKPPIGGAVNAARTLLLDYPDLATLSHEAISNRLGIPRYNVQRACQKLRDEGIVSECTHAHPKPWSKVKS